jgi:hypothetical protein
MPPISRFLCYMLDDSNSDTVSNTNYTAGYLLDRMDEEASALSYFSPAIMGKSYSSPAAASLSQLNQPHSYTLTSLAVAKHIAPSVMVHLRLSSSRYAITPDGLMKESCPPGGFHG